jgi:hypothetical protein
MGLGEGAFVDGAVDLVGGHLHHAGDAQLAHHLHQSVSAEDIRVEKGLRLGYGAVHVSFGGEVDDGVDALRSVDHSRLVADVSVNKAIAGISFHAAQIVQVSRVGQLVQINDLCAALAGEHPPNEGAADEPGPAADEDLHRLFTPQ